MVDFSKELKDAQTIKPVMSPDPKLVWLDLETTGLDPEEGVILEIGVIITDLELKELDRRSWVLQHSRENILTMMDDYVLNMHMTNGLLKDVWAPGSVSDAINPSGYLATLVKRRETQLREVEGWIRRTCDFTNTKHSYLAGSSIHFDRTWLAEHAPTILDTVSYRMLDVSTFKVAFPGLLTQREGGPAHRALDDLDYSIDQLRQMREKLGLTAVAEEEVT